VATLGIAVLALVGCQSAAHRAPRDAPWDLERAQLMFWTADVPSFDQTSEIEASSLAASGDLLIVAAEKHGSLVVIDRGADHQARVVHLDVPRYSELEGVAIHENTLYLCDEAHAAAYAVRLDDLRRLLELPAETVLPAQPLPLENVSVEGGKIGFEGIEIDPAGGRAFLMLERSGSHGVGCWSKIYVLRIDGDRLTGIGEPIEVPLEDCFWRLTDLAWWGSRLIALKTQFPGEKYQVISIDLESGRFRVLLDLTRTMVRLADYGWSNNIEGLAVTDDGALWLVSDNSVTITVDDPLPPPAKDRTLLVRIPAAQ
jgi:hypothetical protein